jgi:outer membrane receptor protein involved in Fe transport
LRGTDAILTGTGNDLNNWPNQSLKFYGRVNLTEKLKLHVDARYVWDFQGAKDGLKGLANAVEGLPEEAAVDAAIARVEDVDAYDADFRLNASLNYDFSENFSAQIFAQNLLGHHDNKRYSYDNINDRASPKRVRFTEEPRTFGFSMRYQF